MFTPPDAMIATTHAEDKMHPVLTDDEIRSNPAFPRVVNSYRLNNRIFWGGLPFFSAVGIYAVFAGPRWAFVVAGVMAVGNVLGQIYAHRRARLAAADVSTEPAIQARAHQLASSAAKRRLVRWLPGA